MSSSVKNKILGGYRVLAAASLALASPLSAQVIISEFMASNTETIADENDDYSDWIELFNQGSEPVNLLNWSLTDSVNNSNKWRFPAVTIQPRQHLLVWASNKNRATAGSPLHTNFQLSASGEYLALIKPDSSKATEFAPAYPVQLPDMAYGGAANVTRTKVIQPGTSGKVLVPSDGLLGETWKAKAFDDSSWTTASNGIGFETGANEFGAGWTGDVLADGPAGYYRFEEVGTTAILAANTGSSGISGAYLNGVTQGVATLQTAGFPTTNVGARFNGTNHKIDISNNPAHNAASFSYSFWMRWNGGIAGTHKSPLTSRVSTPTAGYICYILPTSQRLSFWTGIGASWDALDAPAAGGTIAANTWYHIAGTYDNTTKAKTLYINGAQIATKTVAGTYSPNTIHPLRIGAGGSEGAGQFWFPGELDEVAVFNRSLTATEVSDQYTSGNAGTTGNEYSTTLTTQAPTGYWPLNELPGPLPSLTAVNQGSVGTLGNATSVGLVEGGIAGPTPTAEQGMPADNKAVRMTGGGYYEVPYREELNPSRFTVEFWAKVTGGAGAFRAAVSGRNDQNATTYGYIFYAANNNTWQFWTGSGGSGAWDPITGPAVVNNQWTHVVGTYDGSVKRFYVNGTQVGTGTSATFNPNTLRPLRIGAGANETTANFLFPGDVDEVAIFPRALNASEISQRYAFGKNNTPLPILNDFASHIQGNLQAAMLGNNATAYFRLPFTLADPSLVDGLTLRMKYDDGFQAHLNGTTVASGNAAEAPTWNSVASARSSNAEAVVDEVFNLSSSIPMLQTGSNVLSVQGMNLAANNPDFLQVAELEITDVGSYVGQYVYLSQATPNELNVAGTANPGPSIFAETHQPAVPQPTDALVITCRVAPVLAPVARVTLNWRVNFTAEQTMTLLDDGVAPDLLASDGIYTATIPTTAYLPGNLVRWYFTALDTAGNSSRWPRYADPLGSPQYFGTMVPDASVTTTLPVWHWFTANTAAAATRGGTRGSVFFNGQFRDNVFIRLRGGFTSTGSKKFDFNTGQHLEINPEIGRVEEANLNGTTLASAIAGDSADATLIRPALTFEIYRQSGHHALHAFPVMMRVNGALDTGSGRSGIAYFVEQPDERFLRRVGLDDEGALYKLDQRANLNPVFYDTITGVEKKTRITEDFADLNSFVAGIRNAADGYNYPVISATAPAAPNNPPAFLAARKTYMFDNLDLANMVNYLACRALVGDSDDTRKNFYLYRDSNDSREWKILPWDKDGTLGISLDDTYYNHPFKGDYARRKQPGASANNQWNYLWEALYNEPASRDMYLRRLRTLMETILGNASGSLEARVDAWWAGVAPHKAAATPGAIKTWLGTRRTELFTTYSAANSLGAGIQIPTAQSPGVTVGFGAYDSLPVSGNQQEEFIEITNGNADAVDISGWSLKGGVEHTFHAGTVILPNSSLFVAAKAAAFRARTTGPTGGQDRFVQGDYNGSLSARGETVTLVDPMAPAVLTDDRVVASLTTTAMPTPPQNQLRITEVNYAPKATDYDSLPPGDYEFIELKNIGTTPLDLTGCTFTNGITYTFGAVNLHPGAYLVLAANPTGFGERYGDSSLVVGPYAGSLDNSGERIRLVDSVGEEILDFTYEPAWIPATNEAGGTLTIRNELADPSSWGLPASWMIGADCHGSPGSSDSMIPTLGKPDALRISPLPSGGYTITLKALTGRSYLLQRSADLESWEVVDIMTPNAVGTDSYEDTSEPRQRVFYRVVCP